MRVVVDTNIAFCSLASGCGELGLRLVTPWVVEFFAPRFLFVELFKHKDRLMRVTRLPEEKGLKPST